jgi:23S rRNA (cytosine1962-C5)-methyltransferase
LNTPKIILKKNEERRIRSGHLWVFSNEIDKIEDDPQNGEIVSVFDNKGEFIARGFFNKNSLIAVRVIDYSQHSELKELIKKKILTAHKLRKSFYPGRESFRLVFSESDFLPGLIIDKYNNTFVLQVYSFGMEKNIELVVEILKEEFTAKNIFTLNENHFRQIEGLTVEDKIYTGQIEDELIDDGSIKFKIDFSKGQKTGFYFDQTDNRFFIEKLCKGKTVLDTFCNSGGFGLHAAKAGAEETTFVDSSSTAIQSAKENFNLNGFKNKTEFIIEDVFNYLGKTSLQRKTFDVVMVDPPAFAKNKKNLNQAKKGYEKLNKLALSIINSGGFLVTSSCSYHLPEYDFISIINSAAMKSKRQIQLIHLNNASLDHPSLPSMNETSYLKFAVFSAG